MGRLPIMLAMTIMITPKRSLQRETGVGRFPRFRITHGLLRRVMEVVAAQVARATAAVAAGKATANVESVGGGVDL